ELFEHQANVFREGADDGIGLCHSGGTERALEVGEFDDSNAGVVRTFPRIAGERNLHGLFKERRRFGRGLLHVGTYGGGVLTFGEAFHRYRGQLLRIRAAGIFHAALGDLDGAAAGALLFADELEGGSFFGAGDVVPVYAGKVSGRLPGGAFREAQDTKEEYEAEVTNSHVLIIA